MLKRPPRKNKVNLDTLSNTKVSLTLGLLVVGIGLLFNVAFTLTKEYNTIKGDLDKHSFVLEEYQKDKEEKEELKEIREILGQLQSSNETYQTSEEPSGRSSREGALPDKHSLVNEQVQASVYMPSQNDCDSIREVLDQIKTQLNLE